MKNFFTKTRTGRVLVRIAFVLVALWTVLAVAWSVLNWSGQRAWKAYCEEAAAKGVALSMTSFVRPPIADADNFAAAPVFAHVFATNRADKPAPFALPRWMPVAKSGETLDLIAVRGAMISNGILSAAGADVGRDVLTGLAKYDEVLAQVRVAAKRPDCRWPVRWEDGFAAVLPHLGELRDIARLLRLRMSAFLAVGDSAAAFEDFTLGLRLERSLSSEPTLIAGLVRVAIAQQMLDGVREGFVRRAWHPDEIGCIARAAEAVDIAGACVFALRSERALANDTLDRLGSGRMSVAEALGGLSEVPAAVNAYPTGWIRRDQVLINRIFDEHLALIDPASGVFTKGIPVEQRLTEASGRFTRLTHVIAFVMMPAFDGVQKAFARGGVRKSMVVTACALEKFRAGQGAYPASLDQLIPTFAPEKPGNPDGGGVLCYRREAEGGYLLWSAGPMSGGTSDAPASGINAAVWKWQLQEEAGNIKRDVDASGKP